MKRKRILFKQVRKQIIIPLLISTFLLAGCHHIVKEYYPSGKQMTQKTYKGKMLDGSLIMWYASGVIKQKAVYHNDKLEGLLECWYATGDKELEEMYSNGLRNGRSRKWDEQGTLLEEKNYRDEKLDGSYKCGFLLESLRLTDITIQDYTRGNGNISARSL